ALSVEQAAAEGDITLRAPGPVHAVGVGAAGSIVGESTSDGVTLQGVGSGGRMAFVGADAVDAEALEAGGPLELESVGGGVRVANAFGTDAMTLVAGGGDLFGEGLTAGADLEARSETGAAVLDGVAADGSISARARASLTAAGIAAGDDLAAESLDGALSLEQASAGGDITVSAQGDVTGADIDAGGALDAASAAGGIELARIASGGDLHASAYDTLSAIDVTAGGRLRLVSETGDVLLSDVTAMAPGDGAIEIVAGGGIYGVPSAVLLAHRAGFYDAPQGALASLAHIGPVTPAPYFHLAGRGDVAEVVLRANGDIGRVGEPLVIVAPVLGAFSADGSIRLTALETILGGAIDASRGGLALYSYDGLGTLERLALRVRDDLDLRANDIRADVVHTADTGALPLRLQRIDGRELDTAELWIDAPNGLAIARMHGHEFVIETTARRM